MNDDNDIIQYIAEKLNAYPDIRYDDSVKDQLTIFTDHEHGFDIVLHSDESKSILYLDGFNHRFSHTDDEINALLKLIVYALTGKVKLEVLSKDNKPYKFNLHTQNDEGEWYVDKSMALMFYKFWHKTSTKFLQNQFSIDF